MYTVLIAEDDEDIRQELRVLLQNALYRVEVMERFEDIEEQIIGSDADLVLLDVNLPVRNGMAVCRRIRERTDVPVIFVTARNSAADELNGMLMGGDDYVTKPYHAPVLLARIAAVLKRAGKGQAGQENGDSARLECGGCLLDLAAGAVISGERRVELTRNELRICYYLFAHKGRIVSREELLDDLWDNQIFLDDNTLSVNMTRLRSRLKELDADGLIQTRRGQGYLCVDTERN